MFSRLAFSECLDTPAPRTDSVLCVRLRHYFTLGRLKGGPWRVPWEPTHLYANTGWGHCAPRLRHTHTQSVRGRERGGGGGEGESLRLVSKQDSLSQSVGGKPRARRLQHVPAAYTRTHACTCQLLHIDYRCTHPGGRWGTVCERQQVSSLKSAVVNWRSHCSAVDQGPLPVDYRPVCQAEGGL